MEKAMHQAHGIGYEEYRRKFRERLKVEMRREKDYVKGRRILAEIDRRLYV